MSPDQAERQKACMLRQTFRKKLIVAALVILPTAALPLIHCLCKSWCVIYKAEYHNTEEVYCPLHSQPCTCMEWGWGFVRVGVFLFCWGLYSKQYMREFFFSFLCYLYRRLLLWARYVCLCRGVFCGRNLKSEFPGFISLLPILRTGFELYCANSNQMFSPHVGFFSTPVLELVFTIVPENSSLKNNCDILIHKFRIAK